MLENTQSRQLAAIMFTDIVGYTSIMGEDEVMAFELLSRNRKIQKPLIARYHGKLLKEIGDGMLVSFNTVTEAVYCAAAIQQACESQPDLQLRIGIHQGEVVFEGNDVFGDGVNIASRLEPLAPAGGILVSGTVHRNLTNKKEITSSFLGEQQLRGVKETVKIYLVEVQLPAIDQTAPSEKAKSVPPAVREAKSEFPYKFLWALVPVLLLLFGYLLFRGNTANESQTSAAETGSTAESEELEKTVAVMPFDNFSAEKEQNQYLCDGIMEEVINHLAEINSLVVRSRSSVEQYRDTRPPTSEIGRQLQLTHLLEGSVTVIDNQMKVVVQLIEVNGDRHLWQDSYIQPIENIFDVYTEIAREVANQLEIALSPQEEQLLTKVSTNNPEAYRLYLKALDDRRAWGINRQKRYYLNAIENFQKAQGLDPGFVEAIAQRSSAYFHARLDYPDEIVLDSVLFLCNQAININSRSTTAYITRSLYYKHIGEIDRALLDLQKANQINPNDGIVNWNLGQSHFDNKNYIFGLQLLDRAEGLLSGDPDLFWLYHNLGFNYLELYDKEEALKQWDKMSVIQPNHTVILISKGYIETPEVALELLNKNLSQDQNQKTDFVALGRYYTMNKDFQNALEYYTKVGKDTVMLKEWNLDRYANEGLCLWLTGQKQKGEQLIKKALEGYRGISPKSTYFCDREVRMAAIHTFLGNKREAYNWLNKSNWTNAALYDVQQDVWFSNINQEPEFKDIVAAAMEEKRKVREEIDRMKAAGEWEL